MTHINMMDLLQQYAIGNGETGTMKKPFRAKIQIYRFPPTELQDFSQLSSRTVTEVLMLEMKMAPAAKAYLVSGFPRSMRDVVEYQEKVNLLAEINFLAL